MARPNAAARPDLMGAFTAGATSQTGVGPVPKPSSTDPDIHDNKTSGAGIFVKKPVRPPATRKNAGKRSRG